MIHHSLVISKHANSRVFINQDKIYYKKSQNKPSFEELTTKIIRVDFRINVLPEIVKIKVNRLTIKLIMVVILLHNY